VPEPVHPHAHGSTNAVECACVPVPECVDAHAVSVSDAHALQKGLELPRDKVVIVKWLPGFRVKQQTVFPLIQVSSQMRREIR
jgi:hypothetical protein